MLTLWIAFKLYKFDILKTTITAIVRYTRWLWIAFKLYKFDILKTTTLFFYLLIQRLWIAFKLYKFDILKTTLVTLTGVFLSCELLSNFINLTYWKQHWWWYLYPRESCELLSNFINLTYWKQQNKNRFFFFLVVNCFQTL